MRKITVIIPVYKNKELLLKNLRQNWEFLKSCEVIVIDDASDENIPELIEKEFPKIKILSNQKNLGFGQTVNWGAKHANGDYLFLLNSDVLLDGESYKKAVKILNDNLQLFGVSFAQKEKNGEIVGKNAFFERRGFIFNKKVDNLTPGINGWAEGGCCLLRASYFKQINGFGSLFKPFYHEDNDLSYRANKRGWKIWFEPSILVQHYHESTIRKYFKDDFIKTIAYRNHFIFMWKNITDFELILKHIAYLPYYLFKHGFARDINFFKGFLGALFAFPLIFKSWIVEKKQSKVNDYTVLKLFK
ncbi:hypothetical protein A2690_04130 [Candidatus Roizmanbacteria bacterium RIFCSPHIGHO2_01_FULL_39_12b]|uniref:Glycosyltransferase 2-like domain-containing protein n=1 Tax=Candidatus Roizmanbacteria bacterium RIFCSPHIGHO2_01_FULL_39_12b TaxID=1802030 RepID=A0A1F7GC35_9BACT|nr:MAG: hypothetical protein A2690_04130 [Candidatus Roizmanbacteria bacterium RIFCSPHIGHO2_01_FULL_39_12b]OGK47130.1 MAG: hypothetical protein A3B46_01855 [Candidatus Roizmanbacteria bacterium RIFCSPLOWO2_01_FULL_39_19]